MVSSGWGRLRLICGEPSACGRIANFVVCWIVFFIALTSFQPSWGRGWPLQIGSSWDRIAVPSSPTQTRKMKRQLDLFGNYWISEQNTENKSRTDPILAAALADGYYFRMVLSTSNSRASWNESRGVTVRSTVFPFTISGHTFIIPRPSMIEENISLVWVLSGYGETCASEDHFSKFRFVKCLNALQVVWNDLEVWVLPHLRTYFVSNLAPKASPNRSLMLPR